MKIRFGVFLVLAAAGILVLGTCGMENNASDFGIITDGKYGSGMTPTNNNVPKNKFAITKPLIAHACCELEPETATEGGAAWAVDGIGTKWWRNSSSAAAENGHSDDPELSGLVPERGAHWITLDLGEEAELNSEKIGRLGYTRRQSGTAGNLKAAGTSYEIYVSLQDIGWDVSGATEVSVEEYTNEVANANDMQYIYLKPGVSVKFRYIQLRWRYADTVTAANKSASAANIVFKINSPQISYDYMTAVYMAASNLLQRLRIDDSDYNILRTQINIFLNRDYDNIKHKYTTRFDPPDEESWKSDTAYTNIRTNGETLGQDEETIKQKEERYILRQRHTRANTGQDALDEATDILLLFVYKIDPPKRAPEVEI